MPPAIPPIECFQSRAFSRRVISLFTLTKTKLNVDKAMPKIQVLERVPENIRHLGHGNRTKLFLVVMWKLKATATSRKTRNVKIPIHILNAAYAADLRNII